jgi:protein Tex
VVKAGDVVKVRVVEVDVPRKRIGLTMKTDGGASAKDQARERGPGPAKPVRGPMQSGPHSAAQGSGNAFADALKGKFGR